MQNASTKFHLCEEGGFLKHTVNVAETIGQKKPIVLTKSINEIY